MRVPGLAVLTVLLASSASAAVRPLTVDAILFGGTNCGGTLDRVNTPQPCAVNMPVTFWINAKYVARAAPTVTWTFGDGSAAVTAASGAMVTHTFTSFGRFAIRLLMGNDFSEEGNDLAVGYGEVRGNNVTFAETQTALVMLTRSAAPTAATIHYATQDGTAKAGVAYVAASGDVTFAPGELSKQIPIALINDAIFDDTQSFDVRLTGGVSDGYFVVQDGRVTIIDDDPPPTFALSSSQFDAAENAGHATVVIKRTGDLLRTVSVHVGTGSAQPYRNMVSFVTDVIFAPGETAKSVDIPIADDALYEGLSTATVGIFVSNPGQWGTPHEATLRITDDEPPPVITANDVRVQEGDIGTTTVHFVLTLSRPVVQGTMTVTMADGSAHLTTDYRPLNGTFTLGDGTNFQTAFNYDVQVVGNQQVQADRSAALQVLSALPLPQPSARLIIVDDDVSVTPEPLVVGVGATSSFLASFGQAQTVARTVTAALGSSLGIVSVPSSVTIPAGATSFAIPVTGNAAGLDLVTLTFPPAMFTRKTTSTASVVPLAVATAQPSPVTVIAGRLADITVVLEPPQATATDVHLEVRDAFIASVTATVTVPPGGSAVARVRGLAAGTTSITLTTATGVTSSAALQVVSEPPPPVKRRSVRP